MAMNEKPAFAGFSSKPFAMTQLTSRSAKG